MNKDKTTDSVNESGQMRMRRRAESGLKNLTTNSSDANLANVKGVRNASLRRQTRLVRNGRIWLLAHAHGDGPNSPRTPPKNRDRTIADSFNHGLDEGEQRYERLRAADIKRHGYTELPGRGDPNRAAVFNANTRKIARDRRLAGIVPGSANARPENRSDVLIHSARMSGEKRAAGKPSPRIAPKNRDRKLADSFNHGLEEGRDRNERVIGSKHASSSDRDLAYSRRGMRQKVRAGDFPGSSNGIAQTRYHYDLSSKRAAQKREAQISSPRIAPKNRNRKIITNSFNHGLEEAKRPTTPKRPIKQSKNIFGAAARGAISGMQTPKPAGTSGTKHVLKHAVRNMARHIMDKFF